ncbi:glycosyltransferase [Scardovia wiggsiae]|uniref:glycosyltransferase n=1 Tax=Scardovia wiggsiae TaxID=230143 RepID=UPI00374F456E
MVRRKRGKTAGSKGGSWEAVSRVVFPVEDGQQVMPLYAIDFTRPRINEAALATSGVLPKLDMGAMTRGKFQELVRTSSIGDSVTCDSFTVNSRTQITVRRRGHASLCTFFNAFPAAYWRRWTSVRDVRFSARVQGSGTVRLFKSTGRGLIYAAAEEIAVDAADGFHDISAEIPLTGLMDGGYFWFDVEASDSPVSVADARWSVPRGAKTAHPSGGKAETTLSVAITTFNRAPYCLNQLRTLANAPELRRRIDTVYCVDQGTDRVESQPGFEQVSAELGGQLSYICQRNLGGSGGYSRGMYETVKAGRSDYVLLPDDDAVSEPESILRAVQFEDYAVKPLLVGGAMFHLDNRTVLYTQGERINSSRMWNMPSAGLDYNFDFAASPLRDAPERHQRVDSDYNGWWMCLIPVAVLREIGLSQPFFIKFDDIEFCLRARRHGCPTVCLPGVAVWHQAWHDKDPTRGWEEYFIQRNRWISALLCFPDHPPRMVLENLRWDASVSLRFLYSALALHTMGLKDILKGPEYIARSLPVKLDEVKSLRAQFDDAQVKSSFEDFPEPAGEMASHGKRRESLTMKDYYKAVLGLLGRCAAAGFAGGAKRKQGYPSRPDIAVPAKDASWAGIVLHNLDSALLTAPDGNTVAWVRRDDRRARQGMLENARLTRTILKNWKKLAREYADYDMASISSWEHIFKQE